MQNVFVFLEAHMQNEKENERKQSWELTIWVQPWRRKVNLYGVGEGFKN
jgi:hypothetical protein